MNKPIRIGNLYGENRGTGFAGNIWETEGISPALTTMGGGGNREPIIMEIVRFGESSRGKESASSLGADSYGTLLRTSAEEPSKTCPKH